MKKYFFQFKLRHSKDFIFIIRHTISVKFQYFFQHSFYGLSKVHSSYLFHNYVSHFPHHIPTPFYKTIRVVLQSKYRYLPNLRHNSQFLYIQQCTTEMLSMLCLPVYVSNSIPSAYLPYFFPLQILILSPFTHLSPPTNMPHRTPHRRSPRILSRNKSCSRIFL